jgi:crossover junction endodeoxyribonuclease RusA
MQSITITLPLPYKQLSPNARVHWAIKSKLTKAHRKAAYIATVAALKGNTPEGWMKSKLEVSAYFPTYRFPDPGNFMASLKAYEDGIADSGVIVNDKSLWPERPIFAKDARRPRVILTITKE